MLNHVKCHETGFEILAEETSAFGVGPFDARFGDGDLGVCCVWNRVEEVQELSDWGRQKVSILDFRSLHNGHEIVPKILAIIDANMVQRTKLRCLCFGK